MMERKQLIFFTNQNIQAEEEHVHMRNKMNSYQFDILNRCKNKFSSHEVSFRLHFKTTRYSDEHV